LGRKEERGRGREGGGEERGKGGGKGERRRRGEEFLNDLEGGGRDL